MSRKGAGRNYSAVDVNLFHVANVAIIFRTLHLSAKSTERRGLDIWRGRLSRRVGMWSAEVVSMSGRRIIVPRASAMAQARRRAGALVAPWGQWRGCVPATRRRVRAPRALHNTSFAGRPNTSLQHNTCLLRSLTSLLQVLTVLLRSLTLLLQVLSVLLRSLTLLLQVLTVLLRSPSELLRRCRESTTRRVLWSAHLRLRSLFVVADVVDYRDDTGEPRRYG
jgi:hypothetical protein